jgi:predicted kinase
MDGVGTSIVACCETMHTGGVRHAGIETTNGTIRTTGRRRGVTGPIILINGLPGAGKTTLGRALSHALRLPLFSKDVIKEAHADVLGVDAPDARPQAVWNQDLGAAATETMWALVGFAAGGAICDSAWLPATRDLVVRGLRRANVAPAEVLEVWCEVPAALARRRFEERAPRRHPIHGQQIGLDQKWTMWSTQAGPLALGEVLQVDTTSDVDVTALAARVRDRAHMIACRDLNLGDTSASR